MGLCNGVADFLKRAPSHLCVNTPNVVVLRKYWEAVRAPDHYKYA